MRMRYIIGIAGCMLMLTSATYAQKIDVFNATTIVNIVKERIAKIKTFSGKFDYKINNNTYSGLIYFEAPDKFAMNYFNKNRIISDGKYLWIIYEAQNIAVREVLDKTANPMMGWNLKRLLREYVPQSPPSANYNVKYGNEVCYKVSFTPKNNTAGFRSLDMIVSKDGLIRKISAINQLGKQIELAITYNAIDKGLPLKVFEFEPDEDTQTYDNVLIPQEGKDADDGMGDGD